MLRCSLRVEAIAVHVSLSWDSRTKASPPQKTGEGSLVNGPSPGSQKAKCHSEALSTRGLPAKGPGDWLFPGGPEQLTL